MSNSLTGLSSAEAGNRLKAEGRNELPSSKPRSLFTIAGKILREPMFLLLMACGAIYLAIGSNEDAYILLGSVVIIMTMSLFQEHKSERALEALRDLSSPRALVQRDGKRLTIAGRDLVRGDLIILAEGDRVPADAMLILSQGMAADESLLSGESVPVRKLASDSVLDDMAAPGGEDTPFVFSGTLVVQGKGKAIVLATGDKTALGRIGRALHTLEAEPSRLENETSQAVRVVAWCSSALVLILTLWYGISRGDWLNGILAGLTMAMGILPAELPLILTIFLGLGAWRIAKKRVLTRRISAIEMLGAATVLCVDKTGTLTQNRMELSQIIAGKAIYTCPAMQAPDANDFPEAFHETLEFAMLASHREPFDPMEKAIQEAGQHLLLGTEHIHVSWRLIEDYPLSPELLAMSRVWKSPNQMDYIIAAKGAPEAILDLCHLDAAHVAEISTRADQAARRGLRVLGIAKASFQRRTLPSIQHDFSFQFVGLVALADPLRPTVRAAVRECQAAGIRVKMITGDYPATALSIAGQSGLDTSAGVITGADMARLDEAQLKEKLHQVNVFCRVQPEQKLRLVTAFKNAGEIVAMTGDGVNDAPALKSAHIGIAMGGRGTDVARESAALVLLDDDFDAIVAAVRLGRRIVDNIRKAVVFVIAAHIPLAGLSIIPVMMGWPLILLPVHVVFFELMIDPTCSIVFEAETAEPDLMQRPPRAADGRIFDRSLLLRGVRQGLVLLGILLAIFQLSLWSGLNMEQARGLSFAAMIVGDIWLIFLNRSWTLPLRASFTLPNPALWWVVLSALTVLALSLTLPLMATLFHFQTPPAKHLVLAILAVSFAFLSMRLVSASNSSADIHREPPP